MKITNLNWGEMLLELIKNPNLQAESEQYHDIVGWKDNRLIEITSLCDRNPEIMFDETWSIFNSEEV